MKKAVISHERNVIIGGYVPERPKYDQNKLEINNFIS
jgi:hypothetical protein